MLDDQNQRELDGIRRELAHARLVLITSQMGTRARYARGGLVGGRTAWDGPDGLLCDTAELALRIRRARGFGGEVEYFPAGTAR